MTSNSNDQDLLNAYRSAFALTGFSTKQDIFQAMKFNGLGCAATMIIRDFGNGYAQGLKDAYKIGEDGIEERHIEAEQPDK